MPYVQRDQDGKIVAIWNDEQPAATEHISGTNAEIQAFLGSSEEGAREDDEFTLSEDLQMIRIIEDMIDLLISKHIIALTDLPPQVQAKLLNQRKKRERLFGKISIIEQGDQKLF